jgi:polysaccharide export outer membrane protein
MGNVWRSRSVSLCRAQLQLVLLIAASLFGFWIMPAWAEYRLDGGDVLDISVVGIPALHTKAAIDVDGNIAFPLIGQVKAAGSSIDDLAAQISKLLGDKAAGSSTSEPRLSRITAHEIMIQVVEYCPIYLNGAVTRPGPQPFRPGLTVRQAISVAGGVGRSAQAGALTDDGLWIDYARDLSRIWRLQAERGYLDGETQVNVPSSSKSQLSPDLVSSLKSAVDGIPLPVSVLSQITASESDQFLLTKAAYIEEREYLVKARGEVDAQLAMLLKQQANEQSESDQDAHEFDQVRALYSAKLTTLDKVSEVRHQTLSISNQLVQASSQISLTQRERDTLNDRLRQLESDRRVAIANEIEEANVNLAKIRTSLQALGEHAGEARAERKLQIAIVRKTHGAPGAVAGTEDTALLPGDIVQIDIAGSGAAEIIENQVANRHPTQ